MILIKLIFWYYQCCSICLFSIVSNSTKISQIFLLIWSIVHIILLTTISIIICSYSKLIFFDGDLIGVLTDIIQIAAPFFAHYIVIIASICTIRQQKKIWILFRKIDHELLSLNFFINDFTTFVIRKYFRKSCLIQLICLAIEMRIIIYIGGNNIWRNHWLASIYSLIVCRSFHMWYIFYVDYLHSRIKIINLELIRIGNRHNLIYLRNPMESTATINELRILKRIYSQLWCVNDLMEVSFGWPMLATVTSDFVRCSVNLYWNYATYYFGTNPYWRESLMSSCPIVITFLMLLHSCESCQNTVFVCELFSNFF